MIRLARLKENWPVQPLCLLRITSFRPTFCSNITVKNKLSQEIVSTPVLAERLTSPLLVGLILVILINLRRQPRNTLYGGSLGSCVDEERTKTRDLMWLAERFEHRYLERILRLCVSMAMSDWATVYCLSHILMIREGCDVSLLLCGWVQHC